MERYGFKIDNHRSPKGENPHQEWAGQGRPGRFVILDAIDHADAPLWLREIAAVGILRRAWDEQYAMTLDVYGQLFPDRLDEVADALDIGRPPVILIACSQPTEPTGWGRGWSPRHATSTRSRRSVPYTRSR